MVPSAFQFESSASAPVSSCYLHSILFLMSPAYSPPAPGEGQALMWWSCGAVTGTGTAWLEYFPG